VSAGGRRDRDQQGEGAGKASGLAEQAWQASRLVLRAGSVDCKVLSSWSWESRRSR